MLRLQLNKVLPAPRAPRSPGRPTARRKARDQAIHYDEDADNLFDRLYSQCESVVTPMTDAVVYLAAGDVLTVRLCSTPMTEIKDAKTINFYLFEHNEGFS